MNSLNTFLSEYNIKEFRIPSVDVIDIVDILIVAFFIYNIIVWIKETRAWSLFKGIIVILLFSLFAVTFNLNTILFILKNAISVGIIAVIVVFQPELRKALEEIGKGNFLSSFLTAGESSKMLNEKNIDQIVKAVDKMHEQKTGALIVIEQSVPLGDHEMTGIPIDAVITSQLILNIFEHNTPLHDGAVIIRNNRIVAATCFLPLTDSPEVSMELGTRHRAAIGVSEVSDAYVIIVSEETGFISIVRNGVLTRNLKISELHHILNSMLIVRKRKFIFGREKQNNNKKQKNDNSKKDDENIENSIDDNGKEL